jgi:GTPase SAR1 family protein
MRSIWQKYYQEASGLIFVVDSNDPQRFEEAKAALGEQALRAFCRTVTGQT